MTESRHCPLSPVIDQMDALPDLGDEADAPIIVPRPGQILRRTARTKIRKPGTGEGPHRFKSDRGRRGSGGRAATVDSRTSSDISSSDHGDELPKRRRADSDIPELPAFTRPESYSEEASIYDAYAREESDDSEHHAPLLVASPESPEFSLPSVTPSFPPHSQSSEHLPEPLSVQPVLHHPQPKRVLSPPLAESAPPLQRSPSPEVAPPSPAVETSSLQRPPLLHPATGYQPPPQPSPSPSPSEHRKDKDKKGLFGKWGGDKSGKKEKAHGHREKEKEKEREKEKEKEKESGFFGSLFGGKKKQEDVTPPMGGLGNHGRETAAALLGTSKSAKSYVPSPSPQPLQGYARYPIHVERAIYRLSHIKLANPRRPLYEQVLISNLMFWYLGVINKSPTPASPATTNAQTPAANGAADKEREQAEQEKREREARERAEKERLEKEKEKEREKDKVNEQKRKGSLTKAQPPGTPGSRRAEMPVRGPQYDMQHRAMEHEYAYQGRPSSAPPQNMGYTRGPSTAPAPYHVGPSVQLVQPQPQPPPARYYTPPGAPPIPSLPNQGYPMSHPGSAQLPPGAMPPANVEQTWLNSPPGQTPRASASPSPPRTSSPPMTQPGHPRRNFSPPAGQLYNSAPEKQLYNGQGRSPGRSLSASAAPPVPQVRQNGVSRKGNSAHAVMPHRQTEEEDVPLAVYQQRRK